MLLHETTMESSSKDSKLSLELTINLSHIHTHWYMLKCSFLSQIHHIFLPIFKVERNLGFSCPKVRNCTHVHYTPFLSLLFLYR